MVMISCAKSDLPKPRYTIKGRVFYNYPSKPLINQPITITFTSGTMNTYQSIDLGSPKTDDSGYFSITYNEIDLSNRSNVDIHIFSQFLQIDGIPINQNVNKNFFIPTIGTLQIYLYTKKPLETNHDTLFFGYFDAGSHLIMDTITKTVNGLWKTTKPPVGGYTRFYGRGSKDLAFDAQGYPTQNAHHVDVTITGDPVIDKMTINY